MPPPDLSTPDDLQPITASAGRRALTAVLSLGLAVAITGVAALGGYRQSGAAPGRDPSPVAVARAAGDPVRIIGAAPSTWDPARQGDAGTATTLAQVYEGLTAFDADAQVQPALARDWVVAADGQRITFELRRGLKFSDGTPIRAQDVVESWFRLIHPETPSPLASLLADVKGAVAYQKREIGREGVGMRAEEGRVVVEFRRPATYFLAVTASPSLAVVPPKRPAPGPELPPNLVVSGAYLPTSQDETRIHLEANGNYWAGPPPIERIEVVTDLQGESTVLAFQDGDLDYTGVSAADAAWLRYHDDLGPQLRRADTWSVDYYGFDTTRPPFDDARVRRAFAGAVDWDRLVRLADASADPATSLVPEGIPARPTDDFSPRYDPAGARAELAAAGYPGGRGFPPVTLVTSGYGYDQAIARELKEVLGVEVRVESMPFDEYFARLDRGDVPAFWALSWVADYPAPHDFLGLLLETGSSNNYSGWSNAAYDTLLAAAAATEDPVEQQRHYAAAQAIVQREVPLVPLRYGESWALSREGLLGTVESGLGLIRYAGLDRADE